jgi:hypothetical protein
MKTVQVLLWALLPACVLAQSRVKPPPRPPGTALVRVEPGLSLPEREREVRAHRHKLHLHQPTTTAGGGHTHRTGAAAAAATLGARAGAAGGGTVLGSGAASAGRAPCGANQPRGCEINATFRPEPRAERPAKPAAKSQPSRNNIPGSAR